MRILVIGSEGVLGKPLVKRLREYGHNVYRCDIQKGEGNDFILADIRKYDTLEPAFVKAIPDIVFQLAGEVSRYTCEDIPSVAFDTNVMGIVNVVKLCHVFNSRIVYASSSEVYGSSYTGRDDVDETMPCVGQFGVYGLTKWMGEEIIDYWHRRYGLKACIMRIVMSYGPGEFPYHYRSAVAQFIDKARRAEPITVHKGTERSWCYVDDTIEGLITALECRDDYNIFNIGREEPVSSLALANLIIELTGSASDIIIEEPENIIPVKRNDYTKIKRVLGWEAKTPLKEGLEKTIAWHQATIPL